jgi:general secretion pathway protein F/type IV pilus assembly protein PilC
MIYQYRGIDKKGQKRKGQIEAETIDVVKQRLKSQGIFYTDIRAERSLIPKLSLKRAYRIKPSELAILSRDLAIFIKAGIPIVKALGLLKNQYEHHKKIETFLQTLITSIDEGKTLYGAMEKQSVVILPQFYKQAIKVSEESGILAGVLQKMSTFLKERERINKQIQGAFAYPAFILIASIGMVAFMISYVVPKIANIFTQMGQELPPITKFVISAGNIFSNYWVHMLIVLIAVVILFYTARAKIPLFRTAVDRALLSMPFFGAMLEKNELGKFSYMSAVLVQSGVPFVQAINLSAQILNNSVIKELFLDSAQKVVEGKKLSIALKSGDFQLDPSFLQAIAIGEETSEVSSILQNLSELYFEENKDRLDLLLSLLEPALMLFVGGVIGFIVTAMLLPIFSINIQ